MADELAARSFVLTFFETSSMIVFNVLSLLGNLLVCISVYRNTRLRTITNLYIIALALSDLLAAIIVMPLSTGVLIAGRWPFGETACQIHAFFSLFVIYVSPVTMGLTALNRYVRICKSDEQYKRFFSRRNSRALIASAWVTVALYILIPRLTGLRNYRFSPGFAACLNDHLTKLSGITHFVVVVGFFFILPLAVTIFSYRRVLKKIQEHNVGTAQALHTQANTTRISANEIRISRSLFVVVFAFMLCWLPPWVIVILPSLRIVSRIPRNLELLGSFCVSLSNTINPFIYAGMNSLFRKEFRKILQCKSGEVVEAIPPESVNHQTLNTLLPRVQTETVSVLHQQGWNDEDRINEALQRNKGTQINWIFSLETIHQKLLVKMQKRKKKKEKKRKENELVLCGEFFRNHYIHLPTKESSGKQPVRIYSSGSGHATEHMHN